MNSFDESIQAQVSDEGFEWADTPISSTPQYALVDKHSMQLWYASMRVYDRGNGRMVNKAEKAIEVEVVREGKGCGCLRAESITTTTYIVEEYTMEWYYVSLKQIHISHRLRMLGYAISRISLLSLARCQGAYWSMHARRCMHARLCLCY